MTDTVLGGSDVQPAPSDDATASSPQPSLSSEANPQKPKLSKGIKIIIALLVIFLVIGVLDVVTVYILARTNLLSSPVGVSCRAESGFVCMNPIFNNSMNSIYNGDKRKVNF